MAGYGVGMARMMPGYCRMSGLRALNCISAVRVCILGRARSIDDELYTNLVF
jgi:hypothetical protein